MAFSFFCTLLRLIHRVVFAVILVAGGVNAQPRISANNTPLAPSLLRRGVDGLHTIENGQIKVGVNTNYGGAITYLAFLDSHGGKVSTANMVNNPDLGRQIQIALYSGPIDYSDRWGWHLGWDPIQAGDTYGNSSEVVVLEEKPNLLYVKTIPKQFGIPNEPGEATIEHWIHLEGNLVKVHAKVVMLRSDKNQYEARQQEFPCAYLNGDYHNMWFYKGSEPYTNDKLSLEHIQPPSTMLFGDVYPTEPWMASTNDNGYGMGLYVKDNYEWKRGYFGSDLSGDEYSTVASYIAAANRVVLDHNLVYEWDYELIVGHLDEIRSHIYTKTPISALINYRFDTSRKGWYYHNAQDTGLPIQGKLHVNLTNPDNNNIVAISSPYSFWKGGNNPKLYLRAAFKTKVDKFRMRWRRSEDATMLGTPDRQLDFSIINDGQFHTYEIDLSQNADWLKNNIGQVEFGAIREGPLVSGWTEIEWLSTAQNGPLDQPVVAQEPVVIQDPTPTPCEPRCVPILVKRVTYIRAK